MFVASTNIAQHYFEGIWYPKENVKIILTNSEFRLTFISTGQPLNQVQFLLYRLIGCIFKEWVLENFAETIWGKNAAYQKQVKWYVYIYLICNIFYIKSNLIKLIYTTNQKLVKNLEIRYILINSQSILESIFHKFSVVWLHFLFQILGCEESCQGARWHHLFKGQLRYKTITSQVVSYEAQFKNFLFYRKVMFCSQDIQIFVF